MTTTVPPSQRKALEIVPGSLHEGSPLQLVRHQSYARETHPDPSAGLSAEGVSLVVLPLFLLHVLIGQIPDMHGPFGMSKYAQYFCLVYPWIVD